MATVMLDKINKVYDNGYHAIHDLGSQQLSLDASVLAACPTPRDHHGIRVVFGIRPEDFEDAAQSSGGGDGKSLTAPVTLLEALGSEIMVHFQLDAPTVDSGDPDAVEEAGDDTAANAVGRFSPRSTVRMGQTAQITVATENAHFFDTETRTATWD